MEERVVPGDHSTIDDLLWTARAGKLPQMGRLCIAPRSGIGPLVEYAIAKAAIPTAYVSVTTKSPAAAAVLRAQTARCITGNARGSSVGAFPLALTGATSDCDELTLWKMRFQAAAEQAGFPRVTAQKFVGALGELQGNVFEHSGQPESGLLAYRQHQNMFEFVVADAGIGVLESLRSTSKYAHLPDAGAALKLAIKDGNSRLDDQGRGVGISQIFRSLVGFYADIRFRSGDHALLLCGDSPNPQGEVKVASKAALPGLSISVLCRTRPQTQLNLLSGTD